MTKEFDDDGYMQDPIRYTLLGALILGAVLPGAVASAAEFKPGQLFPEIILPKLADGSPGAVADFRGKKLILHIFASW